MAKKMDTCCCTLQVHFTGTIPEAVLLESRRRCVAFSGGTPQDNHNIIIIIIEMVKWRWCRQ